MHNLHAALAALAAVLLLGACGTTASIDSTYTAPNAGPLKFSKVMVIALTDDGGLRRSAEDVMATQVAPAEPVVSYRVVANESELNNRDVVCRQAARNGHRRYNNASTVI